ncbi:MAG: DUF6655 family protein [Bythopirellula sp.]
MFHLLSLHTRALCLLACVFAVLTGCGSTRTSNTQRTATEQLLISDAIDRTVQTINFSTLAGESVFFDERHLYEVVDDGYLISSLRQHLLASGCILKDNREEATYVVEPRAGAIGTDNDDLLFGVPATNLPQVTLLGGLPPAIPELPIIKRHHQRGVAKIAVFAYRRDTGEPIWQSGIATNESTANDVWFFGAGPFKKGTIHKGTTYGNAQQYLTGGISPFQSENEQTVSLGQEAIFARHPQSPTPPRNPIPYLASAPQPTKSPPPSIGSNGPAIFPPPANRAANLR